MFILLELKYICSLPKTLLFEEIVNFTSRDTHESSVHCSICSGDQGGHIKKYSIKKFFVVVCPIKRLECSRQRDYASQRILPINWLFVLIRTIVYINTRTNKYIRLHSETLPPSSQTLVYGPRRPLLKLSFWYFRNATKTIFFLGINAFLWLLP